MAEAGHSGTPRAPDNPPSLAGDHDVLTAPHQSPHRHRIDRQRIDRRIVRRIDRRLRPKMGRGILDSRRFRL